jgi:hypothetical protein
MRRILTSVMAIISVVFLLLLLGSIIDDLTMSSLQWSMNRSNKISELLLTVLCAVVFISVTWTLVRYNRRHQSSTGGEHEVIEHGPLGSSLGSAFDEGSLSRRRLDVAESKPRVLRGRIREIRRWRDESSFFPKETMGFHLDYDQSQADYGDILIRLRKQYFGSLRLQDGDEIEVDLKWKRHQQQGYIACLRNMTSGQLLEPKSISSKSGTLESIDGGGRAKGIGR